MLFAETELTVWNTLITAVGAAITVAIVTGVPLWFKMRENAIAAEKFALEAKAASDKAERTAIDVKAAKDTAIVREAELETKRVEAISKIDRSNEDQHKLMNSRLDEFKRVAIAAAIAEGIKLGREQYEAEANKAKVALADSAAKELDSVPRLPPVVPVKIVEDQPPVKVTQTPVKP